MAKDSAVKNLDKPEVKKKPSNKPEPIQPQNILGDKKMESVLEGQEKVTVMLENRRGEFKELDVTLNGVRYTVPRGRPVLVPEQVAQIIYERLESEGKLNQVSQEMMSRFNQGMGKE